MPWDIRGPAAAVGQAPHGVGDKGESAHDPGDRTRLRQDGPTRQEARRHEGCADGEPGHRDGRRPAATDARAQHRGQQVQQGAGNDERQETEQVQPCVRGLDRSPSIDHRAIASHEGGGQGDPGQDIEDGDAVRDPHDATSWAEPTSEWQPGSCRDGEQAHDIETGAHPGDEPVTTGVPGSDGERPDRDQGNGGHPQAGWRRRCSRERGREEGHHRRDGGPGPSRQEQVQWQPRAVAYILGQQGRQPGEQDEDACDRHATCGDPAIGAPRWAAAHRGHDRRAVGVTVTGHHESRPRSGHARSDGGARLARLVAARRSR